MKIYIGSDHGGFLLKEEIKKYLISKDYEVEDVGTNSLESCDYSTFAIECALKVASTKNSKGILICTTGEGVMIAANKVNGIRCGLVYNEEVAKLIREHNNCNMMSLGAKYTSKEVAIKYIDIFLSTPFAFGRHERRVKYIEDFENKK